MVPFNGALKLPLSGDWLTICGENFSSVLSPGTKVTAGGSVVKELPGTSGSDTVAVLLISPSVPLLILTQKLNCRVVGIHPSSSSGTPISQGRQDGKFDSIWAWAWI